MDLNEIERRVQSAYERGRLKRAALFSALIAAVSLLFASLAAHLWLSASLAVTLVVASFVFLWRGQDLERGLATGLLAGSVPLLLAFAARPFGHGCEIGGNCYSWCVPACAVGGALATALVVRAAQGAEHVAKFGGAAGLTTVALGTLGCSCVSMGGAAVLAAVFVVSAVPALTYVALQPQRAH